MTLNSIRATLALVVLLAGFALFAYHMYLMRDYVAAIASLSGCLFIAELVRPGADTVATHARKAQAWENNQ